MALLSELIELLSEVVELLSELIELLSEVVELLSRVRWLLSAVTEVLSEITELPSELSAFPSERHTQKIWLPKQCFLRAPRAYRTCSCCHGYLTIVGLIGNWMLKSRSNARRDSTPKKVNKIWGIRRAA